MTERKTINPGELPDFEPKTLAEQRFCFFYSQVCSLIRAKSELFKLPLPTSFPPPIVVCSDEFFAQRTKSA